MKIPRWFKRLVQPIVDKIVYASSPYVELKSAIIDLSPELIDFENALLESSDRRLLEFGQLIRPFAGKDLRKVRVGASYDGGYLMADEFEVDGALSIGIGTDVSWDQDIAERRIAVAMFDPTIRRLPGHVLGGRFFRIGLGNQQTSGSYRTLSELVAMAGFSQARSLLLKIDIEGSEYAALRNLRASDLQVFRQIVIEFHNLTSLREEETGKQVLECARLLAVNHYPVHVHGNNFDALVRFGNLWFPNALEVTYLHKSLLSDAKPATSARHDSDSPCDPRVPDFNIEGICRIT